MLPDKRLWSRSHLTLTCCSDSPHAFVSTENTNAKSNTEEPLRTPEIYTEQQEVEGELVAVDENSKTYQTGERQFTTIMGGEKTLYKTEDSA